MDGSAHHRRIGPKPSSEHAFAQNRHFGLAGSVLGGGEHATEARLNSKHFEVARGHPGALDAFGIPVLGETERDAPAGGYRREGLRALLHHEIVADGHRARRVLPLGSDVDQPVRLGKGEGLQHYRVQNREQGGGCADSESQGKDRYRRERAVFPQLPDREADVVSEVSERAG